MKPAARFGTVSNIFCLRLLWPSSRLLLLFLILQTFRTEAENSAANTAMLGTGHWAFNPPVQPTLPPVPEEIAAFMADQRKDAFEQLVDRVLADSRYGERWGRHWLDVIRFAESNGFETNRERTNAWKFRDYVIAAFNQDKPYDQFVREQIAGDALGADVATGFLVGGAVDIVKSPDIRLTAQQRADELDDMVATTGTAFLGLTLGCARCHSHKFDPISQNWQSCTR